MTEAEWEKLKALRDIYLSTNPIDRQKDYWTPELLHLYDLTFGKRIEWKWRAVLNELKSAGLDFKGTITDFGCGSGVAVSTFLDYFPIAKSIQLIDRSPAAKAFAQAKLKHKHPALEFSSDNKLEILLISHTITELSAPEWEKLLLLIEKANTVLWIEPGTPEASRKLIEVREKFRSHFRVLAPCPHEKVCGLTKPSQHWCHFLAPSPSEAHQSAFWREFSERLQINIRSLPVSYLVLSKELKPNHLPNRVLAGSRFYKGYAQVVVCNEKGVSEEKLLERNHKPLIKTLKQQSFSQVFE